MINTFEVLEQLGISDIRVRDALLRMSNAGDLLRESIDLGSQAWDEDIALQEEAMQRYATTESLLQLAKNAVNELGIEIGDVLSPAVGGAADKVAGLALVLADLPDPLQRVAAGFGIAASGAALLGGATFLLLPRVKMFTDALAAKPRTAAVLAGAWRGTAAFLTGAWGLALGGAIALGAFAKGQADAKTDIEMMSRALEAQGGAFEAVEVTWMRQSLEAAGSMDNVEASL